MLQILPTEAWDERFTDSTKMSSINQLENGDILYFPHLAFSPKPEELCFLTPDCADPDAKNIGYHPAQHKLWGVRNLSDEQHTQLKSMLDRFFHCRAWFNKSIITTICTTSYHWPHQFPTSTS